MPIYFFAFAISFTAREPHHLHPGMTLAERYLVGQVLGFGMVGVTYKAWDTKLNTVYFFRKMAIGAA